MNQKYIPYQPDTVNHPGETLAENIEYLGISQKDLALRTGLTEKHIGQIINGEASITPETAVKLEKVVGGSALFWTNLDTGYRASLALLQSNERLTEEAKEAKWFDCYSDLVQLGFVHATRSWEEKAKNLLKFFRVDSLKYVLKLDPYINFRRDAKSEINQYSLAAWLRCGEIRAENIEVPDFNRELLISYIPKLRALTHHPENFRQTLRDLCFECGVVLTCVPYFKKTKINGASRWFNSKPLIQINTRGAYSDIFWFTFFHELGHILHHGKKDRFFDFNFDPNSQDIKEQEANAFASD